MLLVPPLAEVENLVQTFRLVKKLSLVNQQARVTGSVLHRLDDLVEGNDLIREFGVENSQRQKRAGQLSRNRNLQLRNVCRRRRMPRHHDWAVVIANRSAVRQQRILVVNVRVGVKADGGNVVRAAHRLLVQRLNVFEKMLKVKSARVQLVCRQTIEHERIIGIR